MSDPKTFDAMEADIRGMAGKLRPQVAAAPMPNVSQQRPIVTGNALRTAIVELQSRVGGVEQRIHALVSTLIGSDGAQLGDTRFPADKDTEEPLFPALARKLVELTRSIERIEKEITRGTEALK